MIIEAVRMNVMGLSGDNSDEEAMTAHTLAPQEREFSELS
jgi:hypothetical protein